MSKTNNEEVTISLKLKFDNGNKTVKLLKKEGKAIELCDEGKLIMVDLSDGQNLIGIFQGVDQDCGNFMISKLPKTGAESKLMLGYPIKAISDYYESAKSYTSNLKKKA
ncbi:MAG: hypothetical protein EOP41_06425 [Sphingobacteriaceae bacterium]|nr:MAG: hypothetical protein EOP41_06425 [Sphingobacteriaceae bacterium]